MMSPEHTPNAIESIVASSRSHLYRLLATVFAQEPTAELIQAFDESSLRGDLAAAGLSLSESAEARPDAELAEVLGVEFASLFLVPGPQRLVPCESIVRGQGRYWGDATVDVKQCYELCGYEVVDETALPPDHLSVELEFMGHLTRQEAAAAASGDAETVGDIREVQRSFLADHLGKWVGPFADKVEAASESEYYGGFARLTRDFIQSELNDVQTATSLQESNTQPQEVMEP